MINFSNITVRNTFRLDAAGAFASFLMNGLVLPQFSSLLGIEPWKFHALAGLALGFMFYGLFVSFKVSSIENWMLKLLMLLNLSYCVLTTTLIFLLPNITKLGVAALVIEIIVVLAVIWFEYQVLKVQNNK